MKKNKIDIEKILGINLVTIQKKHFEAIHWLISENTPMMADYIGKSFLMATVFIQCAMERPNKWIYIFDHIAYSFMMHDCMQNTVKTLIQNIEDKKIKSKFEYSKARKAIRYKEEL